MTKESSNEITDYKIQRSSLPQVKKSQLVIFGYSWIFMFYWPHFVIFIGLYHEVNMADIGSLSTLIYMAL